MRKLLFASAIIVLEWQSFGYSESDLKRLGFDAVSDLENHGSSAKSVQEQLRQMISAGCRANELRRAGFALHHCKTAEYDARECERLGFSLNELAAEYSIHELKRVGFGIKDLNSLFSGPELKSAGFSATDMRNAGYSIRELLRIGYSENQIRAAGFSNRELAHEGLARQTVDKTTLQKW